MQYYHNPENLDEEEVISCLQRIFAAVRVSNLKILGGEPFVCQKKLIRILEYLKEAESRFDEAEIITNGTILPSEECTLVLKNTPKLKVVFSNYGELSSRLEEFKSVCEREGIGCDVVEDEFSFMMKKKKRRSTDMTAAIQGDFARAFTGAGFMCVRDRRMEHTWD